MAMLRTDIGCSSTRVCVHIYIYTHTYAYIHVHICVHIYMYIHLQYMYRYMHMYVYMYIYIYVYVYIYTYLQYICIFVLRPLNIQDPRLLPWNLRRRPSKTCWASCATTWALARLDGPSSGLWSIYTKTYIYIYIYVCIYYCPSINPIINYSYSRYIVRYLVSGFMIGQGLMVHTTCIGIIPG